MGNKKNELIDPLLKSGKIFKLKCEKCKSISVQISKEEKPDSICFECGGKCVVL
ncbi:hypothetical protein [Faecalimicrobium sp. JNUCC 81]